MLRITCLLLTFFLPAFGDIITGGYFDLPGGQFELKAPTFDVFGYVDLSTLAIGNTFEPYASGQGPEPVYFPLNGAVGRGTVDGIYYPSLWFNDLSPETVPLFSLLIPSSFSLTGPTIYGVGTVETVPFTINGELNIFTLDGCIGCYIPISGTGRATWTWQYQDPYGGAVARFDFTDPTTVPEPTTFALGFLAIVISIFVPVCVRIIERHSSTRLLKYVVNVGETGR
jgi:hypothetical protein